MPTTDELEQSARDLAEALRRARNDARERKTELADVVHQLTARGVTWTHIGELLGISRQGAQRIYGEGRP